MNRIYLAIVFWMSFNVSVAQVQSNCVPPPALQYHYNVDVKNLALTRINALRSADTSSIVIPQVCQDSIWRGLAAIYNATSIPQRNEVFDVYCVHNSSGYTRSVFNSINVTVDTLSPWISNWRNLIAPTGNQTFDDLLLNYGFSMADFFDFPQHKTGVFTTDQLLNVKPLIDSLETFAHVVRAEKATYHGDGDKITYAMVDNYQYFNFFIGWGDCSSGCTGGFEWRFKVDYNTCSVYFLGVQGVLPLPTQYAPRNCNISAPILAQFQSRKIVCINSPVQFIDSSVSATNWQWVFGDGDTSILQYPSHTYSQPGKYRVELWVSNGYSNATVFDSIEVVVNPNPAALLVSDTLTTEVFTTYEWLFDSVNIHGADRQFYKPVYNGSYSVVVTDSNGCVGQSLPVQVVFPELVASFIVDGHFCFGTEVIFVDSSVNSTSWQWDFGDGQTSSQQSPGHSYITPGEYVVTLIASNVNYTDTSTDTVLIYPSIVPEVIQNGDTLITQQFAVYQWLLNGTYIDGGIEQRVLPLQSGSYSVIATDSNGCIASSAPFAFTYTSTVEIDASVLKLLSNPVENEVVLLNGMDYTDAYIYNTIGQCVIVAQVLSGKVNVEQVLPGIYMLVVQNKTGGYKYLKFIKK